MYWTVRICTTIRFGNKKKIREYKIKGENLGLRHKMALILFYFKIDIMKSKTPIDDFARYWNDILYLEKIGILPAAQVPLKFEKCQTNR